MVLDRFAARRMSSKTSGSGSPGWARPSKAQPHPEPIVIRHLPPRRNREFFRSSRTDRSPGMTWQAGLPVAGPNWRAGCLNSNSPVELFTNGTEEFTLSGVEAGSRPRFATCWAILHSSSTAKVDSPHRRKRPTGIRSRRIRIAVASPLRSRRLVVDEAAEQPEVGLGQVGSTDGQ